MMRLQRRVERRSVSTPTATRCGSSSATRIAIRSSWRTSSAGRPLTEGPLASAPAYTGHWKIGSVPVGGVIEVVEFDDTRDLAWIGITGVSLRGRFRLRDAGDGRTKVTFRLSYEAPGECSA